MKLIQFIVRLGIPIAAFMALGVGVNELAQHPQPLIAFGLFWLLELFYVPYVIGAPWFNQSTYANLMRIGLPTLTWGGMAWGLGGLLMSHNGHPFPSGTSYLGISLLMALFVFGLPLNFKKRARRTGGPQPLHRAGGDLTEAVNRAVEKVQAEKPLALEHDDMQQVADAVGVPVEALSQAVSDMQHGEVMPSQPTPQTSLKKS
jgi:hypothetical protein